jgi:hypothetical protein
MDGEEGTWIEKRKKKKKIRKNVLPDSAPSVI